MKQPTVAWSENCFVLNLEIPKESLKSAAAQIKDDGYQYRTPPHHARGIQSKSYRELDLHIFTPHITGHGARECVHYWTVLSVV